MNAPTNGDISFWYADIGGVPGYRPPLPADMEADVCIVGAGYTGLWTAYYLKKADPTVRIVIVEREFAGFGGSGRNGGWLVGEFGWSRKKYLERSSRAAVIAMQEAMLGTVDEVIAVAEAEGIDADIRRADNMYAAVNGPQMQRAKESLDEALGWGVDPDRVAVLGAAEARARINIRNLEGAYLFRGMARVQPAKLVRGLAATVERLGVPIYEQTAVSAIETGRVVTDRGVVRAPIVVRATEGFTPGLPGHGRAILPLNSALIVTEPLPQAVWDEIGWDGYEVLGDMAHMYGYAQRTREGRIAMGGRGVPYRFGSATDLRGRTQDATITQLRAVLASRFPQAAGARIDHAWCGVLGVPRDWCASVGRDRASGLAWAGGYVGTGVSSTNLAGRTLRDLILGRDTDIARLPWVNRAVRNWEPEPLRWLGVHSMYQLYRIADAREAAGLPHTSRLAALADRITGH